MRIRGATCLLLCLIVARAGAAPRDMSLAQLIEALEAQGYRILYSASLVPRGRTVTVDEVNLETLEDALGRLGLALESREGIWVIVRRVQPEEPPPAPAQDTPPVLETVIVTGSRHRLLHGGPTQSSYAFSPEDLALAPTLGSDALRATLRLPGVSSVGVSAKPAIRGGLQDELLILQDGVELLEPFHLADYHSPYSGIDYHTIEALDIYTGGFPSRYGYRMSGVMEISNRWRDDEYDTDIGASSYSNFVHTRGQLGTDEASEWLLSYRQGDLSDLTKYIDTRSGDPKYQDAAARLNVQLNEAITVSGGLVYAEDDVVFKDTEERASSRIDNGYAWLATDWLLSPVLASRFNLSWVEFQRKRDQESGEVDPVDPGKRGFLEHKQDIGRLALRNDWSALAGADRWEMGWQLEYNEGKYRHRSRFDRGELAVILGEPARVERDIGVNPSGWSGGTYAQLEWAISERLTIQPSLRLDAQDYYIDRGSDWQLSPRLGLAYDWNDSTLLRLSVGRFQQQEGIQELQVLDGVDRFYAPQRLDQVVAGVQWQGIESELMAEVYYKRYDNLKGRFENIFNPFVLLPELEPDRVQLSPHKAEVFGFDLDARRTLVEPLEAFLRYSYMDAQDRIGGRWIDRRWSQEHTVNGGLEWRGETYSLALATTWHSGWRTTRLPAFVPFGEVIPVESVLNNTGLDDYYSIDISARKFWEFPRARLEVYADIINVTDRNNQAGIDFDIQEVAGGYRLTPDTSILLDRIISVGITLSF